MSKFPTYRGELPECLNPLNPRHYFLLLYWVLFRLTALKCYFYQADPELYRSREYSYMWRIPVYRNAYIIVGGIVLLLSVLIGLPSSYLSYWIQALPMNWLKWTISMVVGVVVGVTGSMGLRKENAVDGVILSVAFGVVVGVTGGVAGDMMRVVFGVAFGVLVGMVFGEKFGILAGMMVGVAGGVMSGMLVGMTGDVIFGMMVGVMVVVASGVGVLRLIFYPFQFALALFSGFLGVRHPLERDELIVLPLPRMRTVLAQRLQQDEKDGLCLLAEVARNPFQRWVTQAVLYRHLHVHSNSLNFIYLLLIHPKLDEYVIAPKGKKSWERNGTTLRHLFLGELSIHFVETVWGKFPSVLNQPVWWISYHLRERYQTPLTKFAEMLYELIHEKTIEEEGFDLLSYAWIYNNLPTYSGGGEIARSFEAITVFLSYNDLSDLPTAVEIALNLIFDNPIRPTVLTALNRLGEIGAEIVTYQDSTSHANQITAFARATDTLKDLDEYVQAEVMVPEQHLLRRIIRQWQALIIEAGGELGRAEVVGPVENPYVAGNPVTGELFVGREDILRRLEELWSGAGQKPSIVIYGHRRMGKSSILHNLGARFGKDTMIVDFNMQRVGLVASTGELLYNLALAIYDALSPVLSHREREQDLTPALSHRERGQDLTPALSYEEREQERRRGDGGEVLPEPDEERFISRNPYTVFDRFLKQVDWVRRERRFIITVDEFELIEQKISEGKLDVQLLDFWRGVIQTYPWFVMAFAGLHTLEEMTRDYWHPLFGSVTGIPVSFLKEGAARKLITQPSADFDLDYDVDAIERIIKLTHGQPYLVQLICHCLVTRFNRQSFEEGVERERRFSLADVEAVINTPEFFRDGDAYFTGVWKQAETGESAEQQKVLRTLAQSETGMSIKEIAQQTGLAREDVQQALDVLQRHDVVTESAGIWQFTVELMRRWVVQKHGS